MALSVYTYVLQQRRVHVSLGYMPRSTLAGLEESLSQLVGSLIFQHGYGDLNTNYLFMSFSSYVLANTCYFVVYFSSSQPTGCEWYLIVMIFISLIIYGTENCFMCSGFIYIIFCLFKSLACFNWVVYSVEFMLSLL